MTAIKVRYHGNSGQKHRAVTSGDSGVAFMVLPAHVDDETVHHLWFVNGADPHGYRCSHGEYVDCCGCVFTYDIEIRRDAHRTLVTQHWGRNV